MNMICYVEPIILWCFQKLQFLSNGQQSPKTRRRVKLEFFGWIIPLTVKDRNVYWYFGSRSVDDEAEKLGFGHLSARMVFSSDSFLRGSWSVGVGGERIRFIIVADVDNVLTGDCFKFSSWRKAQGLSSRNGKITETRQQICVFSPIRHVSIRKHTLLLVLLLAFATSDCWPYCIINWGPSHTHTHDMIRVSGR